MCAMLVIYGFLLVVVAAVGYSFKPLRELDASIVEETSDKKPKLKEK